MRARFATTLCLVTAAVALAGCDDDVTAPTESRTFSVTVENVSTVYDFPASGSFDTPLGASDPGPLMPGGVYEFEVHAAPGARLSFATMFAQSSDWFYAPDGEGIPLWDGTGAQIDGDVTDQLFLWDAGTEEDDEPGVGADQAPRQAGPDTGAADDDDTVRLSVDEWGTVPPATDVLSVTIEPTSETSFRVRIENVGDAATLMTTTGASVPVPLSPGVWVVHNENDPLFTAGESDRGEGLEGIAEDGAAATLAEAVEARTGVVSPLAPGVYAVHSAPSALFAGGMADRGDGLEALAEDASPGALASALGGSPDVSMSGVFDTPDGAASAGPALPGASFTFEITAVPGDRLSFATMYGQSNDLFYAPAEAGLDLFPGGSALEGDVTGMVLLWDAGTEVNERPGVGLSQAPRQDAADTGEDEGGVVRQVNDGYDYPAVAEVVRVTVQPIG